MSSDIKKQMLVKPANLGPPVNRWRIPIVKLKSIVAVPILCLSMVVPSAAWAVAPTNFPDAGVDDAPSLGQFKIRLTKERGQAMFGVNFCPGDPNNPAHDVCVLTSPALADQHTKIGRSDPHEDGDSTDVNGADVCEVASTPNNGNCTTFFTATVKDSDFGMPNPNPFEGPVGTREIHTQIISFKMTPDPRSQLCNDPSETAIRAGSEAPAQPRSIGEIEKTQGVEDAALVSIWNMPIIPNGIGYC